MLGNFFLIKRSVFCYLTFCFVIQILIPNSNILEKDLAINSLLELLRNEGTAFTEILNQITVMVIMHKKITRLSATETFSMIKC